MTEADGTNPKDLRGEKKPPLHLIPPSAMMVEAVVMALGAYKYGPYNWRRKKVRATVYIAALMRHCAAYLDGEDDDDQSGVSHLGSIRSCCGILLDALATGNLVDDRPEPGAVNAEFVEEMSAALDRMYDKLREMGVPRYDEHTAA